MNRDAFRAILLGCCLLAGLADAFVVKQPTMRGLLGLLLMIGAALVLFAMRKKGEAVEKPEKPAKAEKAPKVKGKAAPATPRKSFGRRPSKTAVALAELRQELEVHQQIMTELATRLAQSDQLRISTSKALDERVTVLETAQEQATMALHESRQQRQRDVERLQERVAAQKNELAALAEVLTPATNGHEHVLPFQATAGGTS